jgi:hypothetical protein
MNLDLSLVLQLLLQIKHVIRNIADNRDYELKQSVKKGQKKDRMIIM